MVLNMDPRVFFCWLQNKEGLTLVGVFIEGTTLTGLERHCDARKRTLMDPCPWIYGFEYMPRGLLGCTLLSWSTDMDQTRGISISAFGCIEARGS
jgi:hypothetical protein